MGACGSKGSTSDKGLASDKDGKNAKDRKEAWERIRQAIPREKTAEAKQRRIELFKKFDKNETGKLCYDEVYSGCLEVLKLDEFTSRVARHHEACIRQGEGPGQQAGEQGLRGLC
ncbi:flagellar calcium-binding 24 kDa protein [Trypanosoma cruzi]|nr:flagellar calcium-binding 24 kDa protein [Trypanosoma cruzi]